MRRTNFRQPPDDTRPPPSSADAWVRGTPVAAEKPARLTIDIPPELHSRFKAACARTRTKMKNEVLQFITDWTQKHEKS
jgi:hypothetical protein